MIATLNLTNLQQTSTSQWWRLGTTVGIFDPTYGPMKATYVYDQGGVTTANCSPAYEDPTSGNWYVDEDENETSVVGQEYCAGAFLMATATAAVSYCWVLTAGRNPIAMVTDGTCEAGYGLIASSTDGTWNGIAATQNVATTGTAYNTNGYVVGVVTTNDTSNALAVGDAIFNSCWAGLPCVILG